MSLKLIPASLELVMCRVPPKIEETTGNLHRESSQQEFQERLAIRIRHVVAIVAHLRLINLRLGPHPLLLLLAPPVAGHARRFIDVEHLDHE